MREGKVERNHLTLLAANNEGFRNLTTLSSKGFLEGLHRGKPGVDLELLSMHSEGVIALSGCLASRTSQRIMDGQLDEARAHLDELIQIFGPEDVYLEVQKNGLTEQDQVNEAMKRFATETGQSLVGTADVHYLRREDFHHHAALLCVQTKSTLAAPKMSFSTNEFYLKSTRGDGGLVRGVPGRDRVDAGDRGALRRRDPARRPADPELRLPGRHVREGVPAQPGARGHAASATATRCPPNAVERMEMELGVIDKMGFNAYFLIVWDFVHWSKSNGIAVGPGRGSAAGSIIAYSLKITDVDPLRLRPALRALPERRARVDAGYRHRLLRARPGARDPLRDREVRHRARGADHHLRQDVPARRDARRRARARPRLRRRRQAGEADPGPDHGPLAELRGLPEARGGAGQRGRARPDRQADRRTSPRASRASSATRRSTRRRS